jgi:predicted dehydrogenase
VLLEDPDTGRWVTVFMEATWCGPHIGLMEKRKDAPGGGFLRIEGDTGVINASQRDHFTISRWDGGETVLPLREYPGETISFAHEIETMVDCVRTGTPPEIDVSFGAEVIAVCGAAYLSAIEKRAVTLDEFKDFSRGFLQKHGNREDAAEAVLGALLGPYRKRA